MKLLVGRTLRLPKRLATRPGLLTFWVLGVAVLEGMGRSVADPSLDLIGLAILAGLLAATVAWHLHEPLAWLSSLSQRARLLARRLWSSIPDFTLDLRGTPELPRGLPPATPWALAALTAACAGLGAAAPYLPGALREVMVPLSYTAWIAVLLSLDAVLVLGIVLFLLYSLRNVHRAARARLTRRPFGRHTASGVAVAWLGLLMLGSRLDGWVPLVGIAAAALTASVLLYLPGNGQMTFLWRRNRPGAETRSLSAHTALALHLALLAALVIDLGLFAAGSSMGIGFGEGSGDETVLSVGLGKLFLWAALGAALVGGLPLGRLLSLSRCLRPRASDGPSVFVAAARDEAHAADVTARLGRAGWLARFAPEPPRSTDVRVRIAPDAAPPDEFDPFTRWPLALPVEALDSEATLALLSRRRIVLLRRHIGKGLRRLFKHAARAPRGRGHGVWIGLQHWFQVGLTRDAEPEAEPGLESQDRAGLAPILGPAYHLLFLRAARRHYARVLHALEVDLIFVEDGLGFRRFRRALGVLYETYDVHGGQQRIEERHFLGLPGTRAVLHELSPEQPFRRPGAAYPEPEYENIGRARILHLFRDRGEDETRADVPVDLRDLPVPVLSG